MASRWVLAALGGILLLCAAALLWTLGRKLDEHKDVQRRLDAELKPGRVAAVGTESRPASMVYQWLQRADIAQRPGQWLLFAGIGCLAGLLGLSSRSVWGLAAALAAYVLGLLLYFLWRAAATRQTLVQQLPGFIDYLIRIIGIGRSFDNALLQAITDSPPPLSHAMRGVLRESSLGGDLLEALRQTAQVYRVQELQLLTLALRINQRYGGSIRAMLESIVAMIRQREQAERELRALTGETRLTAWIMGLLPPAMAGYMMIVNPDYIGHLLDDPYGMEIIVTAIGLELIGGFILWRMLWSVR